MTSLTSAVHWDKKLFRNNRKRSENHCHTTPLSSRYTITEAFIRHRVPSSKNPSPVERIFELLLWAHKKSLIRCVYIHARGDSGERKLQECLSLKILLSSSHNDINFNHNKNYFPRLFIHLFLDFSPFSEKSFLFDQKFMHETWKCLNFSTI